MSEIILFATYWNEKYFVEASLEQIDKIDPIEVIICDGCFDPRMPVHSTDGTHEIIKEYVRKRRAEGKLATVIGPVRKSKLGALFPLLSLNNKRSLLSFMKLARWKGLYYSLHQHPYRKNQALTFNKMISSSVFWKNDRWVMTLDADQFYSDDVIETFQKNDHNADILTAKEKTFFSSFQECTTEYEKRTWNNMPHKIRKDMVLLPTRNLFIESFWKFHPYESVGKKMPIGEYFHYKLEKNGRFEATYQLGDRKKPCLKKYSFKRYDGEHPFVIKNHFKKELKGFYNAQEKKPLVSIVMAVHNDGEYVEEAIKSIISQTFTNFEFIIIDDASTDQSPSIIKKYARRDSRIRSIKNKKNIGLTKSLNKGIKIAKGEYIARQDADDVSEKERIEVEVAFLEKNSDVFLCGTGFFVINNLSQSFGRVVQGIKPEKMERKLARMNCICHGSILFKNEKKSPYREKFVYCQDYDFYLNILTQKKRIASIPKALYHLRIHSSSVSEKNKKMQAYFADMVRKFYMQRKKNGADDYEISDMVCVKEYPERYNDISSADYLEIIALLDGNGRLARKKIYVLIFKKKKLTLGLLNLFLKSFYSKIRDDDK